MDKNVNNFGFRKEGLIILMFIDYFFKYQNPQYPHVG